MPVKDCRGSKNLIKDLLDQADIFTYQIDREINKKFPLLKSTKNKFEKINNYLKESYDTATVPMSVLDSLIANGIPKKDGTRDILFKDKGNIKKYQMIYKVHAMLSNPILLDFIVKDFNFDAASVRKIPKTIENEKTINEFNNIKLEAFPTPVISNLYEKVYKIANIEGDENFVGYKGRAQVSLYTTETMKYKEKTGAVAMTVEAIKDFAENVPDRISRFMGSDDKTLEGMSGVYENVKIIKDTEEEKINLVRLFTRVMEGHMFIENDMIMVNTTVGDVFDPKDLRFTNSEFYIYDTKNGVWRYTSTGDKVSDYSNPMPLKDYVKGKSLNRRQKQKFDQEASTDRDVMFALDAKNMYIELDAVDMKIFKKSVDSARVIHKKVYDYIIKEFKVMENSLRKEILERFPRFKNASKEDQEMGLNMFITDFRSLDAKKYMTKQEFKEMKELHKNFGLSTIVDPFNSGLSSLNEKKDSFPKKYHDADLPFLFDEMQEDIDNQLQNARNMLEKADTIPSYSVLELREMVDNLESRSINIANTRARLDEFTENIVHSNKIYSSQAASSLKRITNAVDPRFMRDDSALYYTYLNDMFATLEKGYLTRKVLTALRIADAKKLPGESVEGIKSYIMSRYNAALHKPDARVTFLGKDFSLANINKNFVKGIGVNVSDFRLDRYFRILNAAITSKYLSGMPTATLNYSALFQKGYKLGLDKMISAVSRTTGKDNPLKGAIDGLLRDSGTLDFGDYFSNSLVEDITGTTDLKRQDALKIIGNMFQYHADIRKGMSKEAAITKYKKKANTIFNSIPSVKILKARQRATYEKLALSFTNKWANWAITKDYNPFPFKNWSNENLQKAANASQKGFKVLNDLLFQTIAPNITMSAGEQYLRRISFVMGIDVAIEAGIIDPNFYKLLTQEKTLNPTDKARLNELKVIAIEWGKYYTQKMDYGLSNQATGEASKLAGGAMTKFTVWSQQKFADDVTIFRDAYLSTKYKKGSPLGNMMSELFEYTTPNKWKDVWTENPFMGRLRNFLAMQGPTTLIMDLLVYGPLIPVARNIPLVGPRISRAIFTRSLPLKFMSGLTSDLISLTVSLPLVIIYGLLADEEEEKLQRDIFYKIKKIPFFGYGFGTLLDQIFLLLGVATDVNDEELNRRARRALSPLDLVAPPAVPLPFDYSPSGAAVDYLMDEY
tara:strand:- start:2417 stop:5965 length:3549 start_codon:yes stop_codon:yes gene_type:complete